MEWRRKQLGKGRGVSEDTPHPTQRSPWGSSSLPQGCRKKLQDQEAAPRDSTSAREAWPSSPQGAGSPGRHGPRRSPSAVPGSASDRVMRGAPPVTDRGAALIPGPTTGLPPSIHRHLSGWGPNPAGSTGHVTESASGTEGSTQAYVVWVRWMNPARLNPYLLRILVGQGGP